MRLATRLLLPCSLLAAVLTVAAAGPDDPTPEQRVRDFVAAFNARDLDALAALADPDVQWLSVDGPRVAIESDGVAALRRAASKATGAPSRRPAASWSGCRPPARA